MCFVAFMGCLKISRTILRFVANTEALLAPNATSLLNYDLERLFQRSWLAAVVRALPSLHSDHYGLLSVKDMKHPEGTP